MIITEKKINVASKSFVLNKIVAAIIIVTIGVKIAIANCIIDG